MFNNYLKHTPRNISHLRKAQDRLTEKAIEIQRKEDDRYLANSPEEPTEFDIDTLVLARHLGDHRPHKLASIWEGPLRILKKNGKNYLCSHLASGKEARYDVTRLREYREDPAIEAMEVSTYDNQEDIVREITGHRVKKGKKESTKGAWEFQVVWTDETREWLNYREVKKMEAFDKYVSDQKIQLFEKGQFQEGKCRGE